MSTKRKKIFTALIIVFAAAMLTLAGCKVGPDTAQDIIDKAGLTARVVYYANEGNFNDGDDRIRSIYFKPDSPVLNIAQDGYFPADTGGYPPNIYVRNKDYLLSGWEYAELDKNGNPVFIDTDGAELNLHVFTEDEQDIEIPKENNVSLTAFDSATGELVFRNENNLKVKSSGEAVDFTKKITDEARWYFVAKWVPDVRLNYILVCDTEVKIGGTVYKTNDVIYTASYGNGNSVNVSSYAPATDDSTFLQAYSDKNCTNPVPSVQKPTDGKDNEVYVKYIAGKWDVVKTSSDVQTMFLNLDKADKKFYLFNDINCNGKNITPNIREFKCTILGNGYKIQNLTASYEGLPQNTNAALFGRLTKDAKIENLTLENVDVTLKTKGNGTVSLYMIFSGTEEGAVISGLKLENANFTFDDAAKKTTVSNIPYSEGAYVTDNWMFGGLATDEEFISNYGVSLNGYSLSVITSSILGTKEELVKQEKAN